MIRKSKYYFVIIIILIFLLVTDGFLVSQNIKLKDDISYYKSLEISLNLAQQEISAIKTEQFLDGSKLNEVFDSDIPYTILFVFSTKGCHSCIEDAIYNLNQFKLTVDKKTCIIKAILIEANKNLKTLKKKLKIRFQLTNPKSSFWQQKIILDNLPFVFLIDNKSHKIIYSYNTNALRPINRDFLPMLSRFLNK